MPLTNLLATSPVENPANTTEPHETKQVAQALSLAESALSQLYFSGHDSDSFSLSSATLLAESADHQAVCLKGCNHTHWIKELLYRIHQARNEARLIEQKQQQKKQDTLDLAA